MEQVPELRALLEVRDRHARAGRGAALDPRRRRRARPQLPAPHRREGPDARAPGIVQEFETLVAREEGILDVELDRRRGSPTTRRARSSTGSRASPTGFARPAGRPQPHRRIRAAGRIASRRRERPVPPGHPPPSWNRKELTSALRPEEITSILKERIEQYDVETDLAEVGGVLQVGDGIARIHGPRERLPRAAGARARRHRHRAQPRGGQRRRRALRRLGLVKEGEPCVAPARSQASRSATR